MNARKPHVLVLPGYQNSGAGHWQTRWEALDRSFTRVQMPD
ncbi:putative alpha/beta hydrolase family esterase [Paraburkholderia phenoliruptrix]|nr:putative alpha/beta hydrolase family esterase [Paraburkholderia phenoliruptrix]